VERRGLEPALSCKTACEMRFVDPGVVTPAVPVLELCADVMGRPTPLAVGSFRRRGQSTLQPGHSQVQFKFETGGGIFGLRAGEDATQSRELVVRRLS
jgi:hypothetical protein